ncbi:MAG: AI-2E family transporter, partial [Firmicutes bacterium]|nr:AI-2E family transporter [Bacillota bacterium]
LLGILIFMILRYIFTRFPVLKTTLSAVVISAMLAYVINPLVTYMEKKNISRGLGVIIIYAGFILLLVILFLVVLPQTVREFRNFLSILPQWFNDLEATILQASDQIEKMTNFNMPRLMTSAQNAIEKYATVIENNMFKRLSSMASGMYAAFGRMLSFILVLILTYYFTVDKNRLKVKMYKAIPSKYRSDVLYLATEINVSMLEFVKGKLLLAVIVGVMTMAMLLILRVDFAVVIGLITIVADIIPYIGPFLAFVPAFFFAVMDSWTKAFWVSILFVFLQWAENNLFAPKILGSRTGLHPAIVLLCIFIGGGMFGVIGMILSVPVFSILVILKDFFTMKWRDNQRQREELKKVQ